MFILLEPDICVCRDVGQVSVMLIDCLKALIHVVYVRQAPRASGKELGVRPEISLEEVEAGSVHSENEVYTEYVDSARDEWVTIVRPALRRISLDELEKGTGLSRRALIDLRAGRSRPHPKNQRTLTEFVRTWMGKNLAVNAAVAGV